MKFKNKIIITLVAFLMATALALTSTKNVNASVSKEYNTAKCIYAGAIHGNRFTFKKDEMLIIVPSYTNMSIDDLVIAFDYQYDTVIRETYSSFYSSNMFALKGLALSELNYLEGEYGDNYMIIQNKVANDVGVEFVDSFSNEFDVYLFSNVERDNEPVISTAQETFFYNINNAPTLAQIKANFTATDVEDGNITHKLVFESNYNHQVVGNYLIKATVTDNYGNSKTVTNNIYLVDGNKPNIVTQANHVYVVGEFTKEQVLSMIKATITYTDNYDSPENLKVTYTDNINVNVLGTYNLEVTVTDTSSNKNSSIVTVSIIDNVKPIITAPTRYEYGVGMYTNAQIVDFIKSQINISDNYNSIDELVITYENNIDASKLGSYTLTVKVVDTSNNQQIYTITIEVVDITVPTITPSFTGTNLKGTYIPTEAQLKALFAFSDNYNSLEELTISFAKYPTIELHVWGSYEYEIICTDSSGNKVTFSFTYEYVDGNAPVIFVSGTIKIDSSITLSHSMIIDLMNELGLITAEYKSVSFVSTYFDTPNKKGDYTVLATITFVDDTVKNEELKLSVFEVAEEAEVEYLGFWARVSKFFPIIFNADENYKTEGFWGFLTGLPKRCGQAWDILVKNQPYIVKK